MVACSRRRGDVPIVGGRYGTVVEDGDRADQPATCCTERDITGGRFGVWPLGIV